MRVQLLFLGLTLLQFLVLGAVMIALCDIAKTTFRLDGVLAFCAAVALLGVIGYLGVALAWVHYPAFGIVKIAALALLLIRFGALVYRQKLGAYWSWLKEPLVTTTLFALLVLALGFSNGGLDDPQKTSANRFVPELPVDNFIPWIVAEAVKLGHIASPLYAGWLSSDRPPLQAGLYLMLVLKIGPTGYQIVATWLQATFLFGVWAFAVAAGLPTAARRLVLLACCLLPAVIFNTLYTWPKILTTCYLMMVFALLFCFEPKDAREQTIAGFLLGALAALAALAHGGSMFALAGIAVMVVIAWRWPSWRTVLAGVPALVAVYVPWLAYQALVDPPGNRLLKWGFAGVVDPDPRGFGETLRAAYGALSWPAYVQGRIDNFWAIVGPWPRHLGDLAAGVVSPSADAGKTLRISDFFNLLPSLHVFALAIVVAALMLPFMRGEWREQRRVAACLFGTALIACVLYGVLLFIPGSAVNHQGTYAVHVMATVAAFMVLALRAPALAIAFVALQAVTVSMLYGFTLPHDPQFWPMLAVCVTATVVLFAYTLAPSFRRAGPVNG